MNKVEGMSRMFRLAVAVFALVAVGILIPSASEAPRRLSPPERVGEAYQAYPPPLASLDKILGPKPGLNDLDLYVRSFARIVFEPEVTSRYARYPWIVKWADHLLVSLHLYVEPRHRGLLEQVVSDLTDITGLPITTYIDGDLTIFLDAEPDEPPFCLIFRRVFGGDGALKDARMAVSPLVEGDLLLECFYEDISQALGVWHDTALTEVSMYRSEAENGQWPRPTWHDVIMLRTLYDRRIMPGMHEDQAMPLVRVIIAELLEELNAPAE